MAIIMANYFQGNCSESTKIFVEVVGIFHFKLADRRGRDDFPKANGFTGGAKSIERVGEIVSIFVLYTRGLGVLSSVSIGARDTKSDFAKQGIRT